MKKPLTFAFRSSALILFSQLPLIPEKNSTSVVVPLGGFEEGNMDYSQSLVLYSGGVDSTDFIENEPSAQYLLHYQGLNIDQTKTATVNANILNRFLTIDDIGSPNTMDGETNQIHALYDADMLLSASIRAVSHGMNSIVACFNADDIGTDFDALQSIVARAVPKFKILLPLRDSPASVIRERRKSSSLKTISCMYSDNCGHCAKCRRGY